MTPNHLEDTFDLFYFIAFGATLDATGFLRVTLRRQKVLKPQKTWFQILKIFLKYLNSQSKISAKTSFILIY